MGQKYVLLATILFVPLLAAQKCEATFNVRDFGAKGDLKTNDQPAIQKAVDSCSKAGGGTVYFPAGNYLSSTIRLRSNVTLHIDSGATVFISTNPQDYSERPQGYALMARRGYLLLANDVENIAIVGQGTIHGQGTGDLGRGRGPKEMPPFRTGILLFENCRDVAIRDVKFLYSDAWTVHLKRCQRVFIDGITIINNYYRTNSDGIDPNSCRDVQISNCHISAGDDCIVLKSTESYPCENVVVTNCTLETIATALKLGTESQGDFRNIHFSNCAIRNSTVGIGFYMKDGATMENVTFSNISIETTSGTGSCCPIFMDIERRNKDSRIGRIRDVSFRDVQIKSGVGVLIQGMPESAIENLTMENVSFRVEQAGDYSKRNKHIGGTRTTRDERDTLYARQPSYFTLANVRGLFLDNVRVLISPQAWKQYQRCAVSGHNIENGTIRSVYRSASEKDSTAPVVALENCKRMILTGSQAQPGTGVFLNLRGKQTADISLVGNDLHYARNAVTRDSEAPSLAVRMTAP